MRILLFSLLLLSACQPNQQSASNTPVNPQELESVANLLGQHLLASPKYMMYETDFLHSIHYAEVCMAYGLAKYAQNTQQNNLMDQVLERYQPLRTDSIAWQNHHVDGNVYGVLPFQFYKYTKDEDYLQHGLFMADSQWKEELPNGLTTQTRYWIDDVFMVSSLQLEAYQATNKKEYLNRTAGFTAIYVDSLQQADGLFYHGPEAPIYWGRGNGWMAVGMAATIAALPENHPLFSTIKEGYQKMMASLIPYQSDNGMWRQIIDMPEAWEETSCTAMFAYAMTEGLIKGILTDEKYEKAVKKAWNALKEKVNNQGELEGVCAGTGQSTDTQYYLDRPRINGDFHGQAPMIWLIDNLTKLYLDKQ